MLTELLNLKKYITSTVGVTCIIGYDEISQSDYIRIIPAPFSFKTMNNNVVGTNFPVELQIVVDRDNTIRGFEILEKLVKDISNFNYKSGAKLQEDGTPEYDENNFVITVTFNLKTIIQES